MTKNSTATFYLLITLFFFYSCADKKTTPPADTAGIIQLSKPIAGTVYLNGTSLQIQGTVEDANGLATIRVEVKKSSNSEILFQQSLSANGVTFQNLNRTWTVTGITGNTNAIVRVIATDRFAYEVSKEVNVVLTD